jgi:uncharacterized protein (TIGR03663 family)
MTTPKSSATSASATSDRSWLAQPAWALLRLDWEKLAWIALLIVAFGLRLYDVGARTMSHDESLHTTYSYNLYKGIGYQHDPLMHGPLLFELTALSYFLFGVNDATARLPVVFLGTGIVGLLWWTRRWLGRPGAFLAAVLLTFSPALLYHSRYIRHDIYLIFFVVLLVILAFRYRETGAGRWLTWLAVALGLSFTTMEASFIYAILFVIFFLLWTLVKVMAAPWQVPGYRWPFLGVLAAGALLTIYPLFEAIKAPVGTPVTSARLGGMVMWPLFLLGLLVLGGAFWLVWRGFGEARLRAIREFDLVVWITTLAAPLYAAFPIKLVGGNPESVKILPNMLQPEVVRAAVVFLAMLLLFSALGALWGGRRYLMALGLYYGIMIALFTTFFTNGNGVGTGLVGSVGYWLAQQEVRRGGQPWYYYLLIVPLYEFVPLVLSLAGVVALAWRGLRGRALDPTGEAADAAAPALRGEWLLFLAFWVVGVWGAFTWAGEKMPWLSTHITTPMGILGGWYLAERLKRIPWETVRQRRGLWWPPAALLWLVALFVFLRLLTAGRAFRGTDLASLGDTLGLVANAAVLIGLGWVVARKGRELGGALSRRLVGLGLVGLLAVFWLRTAFLFTYVNYDYPIEPMVYAHGTPDIKIVVEELKEISRRTVGENQLVFAYDDESTWPFEWYFRDFPNKKFFGASPSREYLKDVPVVIVGIENEGKVKPFLGNQYYRTVYRQIWWPKETYKDLSWERIWNGLRDPVIRRNVLNVILYRRYQQPIAEWDPADRFVLFVRKDIGAQIWHLGAAPAPAPEVTADPFEGKYRLEPAVQLIGGIGGDAPGQFRQPRGLAIAPAGSPFPGRIYVADTGNHRVQVFEPDGTFAFGWGSFGEAEGQFNEPWGIGVAADGRVYVVDTWNHRIQVFTPDGRFLKQWGAFVSTDGQLGQMGVFWGPRAIAFTAEGNLLITDTGNKRVQVFDPEGNPLTQFGGGGVAPGYFDEPVGIAVGPDGSIYVADTWNRRVQKFDAAFRFVKEWAVPGWEDQNIFTKPYIAVDSTGTVYASDPTGWRILVWDAEGNPLAVLGQYGAASTDFGWVNGVTIGLDDSLWVADADNHRVMRFNPVR